MNIARIYSFMSSAVAGDLRLSDLTMKKTITDKLLLTFLICMHMHTLGYKIIIKFISDKKSSIYIHKIQFKKYEEKYNTYNTIKAMM